MDWKRTDPGFGLCADTDKLRSWSRTGCGRGRGLDEGWTDHGQQAGQWRGNFALKPRLLRGQQNLENSRGEASTLKFTKIL